MLTVAQMLFKVCPQCCRYPIFEQVI
jgi:hypothetical protein